MSIQRYDLVTIYRGNESWDEMEDAEDGTYVRHDDYAALEAKCAALAAELKQSQIDAGCYEHGMEASNARLIKVAAELSALDAIHDDAVFITDDHYEQCPPEVQKIIRSLAVMQIPAYKSFLAEVRAQGVELFAIEWGGHDSPYGQDAYNFAAKLRQEDAQ